MNLVPHSHFASAKIAIKNYSTKIYLLFFNKKLQNDSIMIGTVTV